MQNASAALVDALNNGHVLKALPSLIIEWNQNRYAGIAKVDNQPTSDPTVGEKDIGFDLESFPIESIVEPRRPSRRGVIKARTSTGRPPTPAPAVYPRSQDVYGEEGFTAEDYSDEPNVKRYYTAGPKAAYKYWTSPQPSGYNQNFNGSYGFPAERLVRPYVIYKTQARTNKVVVTFENTWARPVDYQIQVTTNGGSNWSTISSNIRPDANGQVIVYRHSNGGWDQNVDRGAAMLINGVRVVVNSLDRPAAHLNLVELSARFEADLSEHIISYDSRFSISETSFIAPLGRASSNTGSFTLSNFDGLFNNSNPGSIYAGLIDKNARCTLDLTYTLNNGTTESVREFTMYVDQWGGEDELEMSAECKDASKFLQEEKVPALLFENVTVGEAIWRICDTIGFTDFIYERKDTDPASTLPYFWTDTEETVWETFQQLAEATQTAVYFDEFGMLRIKTREVAYDLAKTPTWNLEATDDNGKLADVVSAEVTADFEANIININYKDTKVSEDNKGFPEMHVLWQPEETFVLRSSQLTAHLTADANEMRITPGEVAVWPYEGMVNIEGELIKFRGKQYEYYNKQNQLTTVWVYSHEEKINIDKSLTHELQRYKSTWTGKVYLSERGVYWSSPRVHTVDIAGWTGRRNIAWNTSQEPGNFNIRHNKDQSLLRLESSSSFTPEHFYTATRGNVADEGYARYGTRVRFPQHGQGRGTAGIVIHNGDADSGYYFELIRTEVLDSNGGAARKQHHEVNMWIRYADGNVARPALGSPMVIAHSNWYDIDVDFTEDANGTHRMSFYVNGILMHRSVLASGRVLPTGRFGMFIRGHSIAEFEYFYAHSNGETYHSDDVSTFDKVRGGYVSGQWDREYVYSSRTSKRKVGKKTVEYKDKYNQYFFDEFGAIVHEVREMEVPFEKYPVLHSRLYVSNTQAVLPEYSADPFTAKFMIANASRDNAVLNGENVTRFGIDRPVAEQMMIYGRLVFQEEGKIYTVKNDKGKDVNPFQNEDAIRRRGKVEVDIDSKWIQSRAEAEALGNWILKHWSGGNDEVVVEVFGNPLFQLGDVVTLDFPDKHMFRETHRYFVVNVGNTFDTGLTTSLTLRRAKI